jgi:penicillin amidase
MTMTGRAVEAIAPAMRTAEALRSFLGFDGVHLGSNAFAVAPGRSSIGRAMVASDPHMPLGAPSLFWEARLCGGGLDVRGFGVPGFPALPIGQNDRGAWGVTAGWGDDSQVWIEDLARLREEHAVRTREETIEVRGGEARRVELLDTPRGPVVSHVVGDELLEGDGDANGAETALVLRWAGMDASADADAALALMRAASFEELREAARLHASPTLNFVWADAEGHVGWQYAGRVPKRRGPVTGLDMCDGDDDRAQWQGWIAFDALPFVLDPPLGVIASANLDPGPARDGSSLGPMFEPPFRFARIHALLEEGGRLGPNEIAAVQRDVHSTWATRVRDVLFEGLDDETLGLNARRGGTVARLARVWDGVADEDSAGALATYALIDAVVRHMFLDDLGEEAFERYFEIMNVGALPILHALQREGAGWLHGRDRATIVRDAAAMAEGRLRRRLGDDPRRWRWGALHAVTFRHPLVQPARAGDDGLLGPGLRAIASPGPYPARGDGTTVCMGEFDVRGDFSVRVAPSLRAIMIAGAPNAGRAVVPPGQSGDPTSRHFRDQIAMYLAGETRAASWDETDFTGKRARLVPA